ncbi:YlmH family RNA-binding protein [Pseudoneobacillus sp. C159]
MNIYQHFRPEEREFIDQALQWKKSVEDTYTYKLTDFLDPRQQQILQMIIGNGSDVLCYFFGGTDHSERKRGIIYPDYHILNQDQFQIILYELSYPKKFVSIEHRQVLGSLMSLGLKRDKFGDILFEGDRIQIIAAKEIGHYLEMQFTSVGKSKVSLREIEPNQILSQHFDWNEEIIIVSSLRLDSIISAFYNISRQKSQSFIEQGNVKVNHSAILKPSFECGEFDLISLRGHGRTKVILIDGKTKKDKWRIVVGKQK